MIANERQYRTAKLEAERFEEAIAVSDLENSGTHPRLRQAMREGLESELHQLREQIAEYEALRGGQVREIEVRSLDELPDALIRARIAAGLTQRELAERLGLPEQQVQRYEATRYAGASLTRIQEVTRALGIDVDDFVLRPITTYS